MKIKEEFFEKDEVKFTHDWVWVSEDGLFTDLPLASVVSMWD